MKKFITFYGSFGSALHPRIFFFVLFTGYCITSGCILISVYNYVWHQSSSKYCIAEITSRTCNAEVRPLDEA